MVALGFVSSLAFVEFRSLCVFNSTDLRFVPLCRETARAGVHVLPINAVCLPYSFALIRIRFQEKDQEAFRRRYFWAYDTTPDGEGNNATSTKLLILPNGKMMSVERREQMDAACADRPKIGDSRPNQVRRRRLECSAEHISVARSRRRYVVLFRTPNMPGFVWESPRRFTSFSQSCHSRYLRTSLRTSTNIFPFVQYCHSLLNLKIVCTGCSPVNVLERHTSLHSADDITAIAATSPPYSVHVGRM